MIAGLRASAVMLLVAAGTTAAVAGPLVPPSDQPGRERYRFTPSPLDRFFEARPPAKPLLRWDCGAHNAGHARARSRRSSHC